MQRSSKSRKIEKKGPKRPVPKPQKKKSDDDDDDGCVQTVKVDMGNLAEVVKEVRKAIEPKKKKRRISKKDKEEKEAKKKEEDKASDRMVLLRRFRLAIQEYQKAIDSVSTTLLTPELADIPDQFLTPSSEAEIQASINWLTEATRKIKLLNTSDLFSQRTGISRPGGSFGSPFQYLFGRGSINSYASQRLQDRINELERKLKEDQGRTPPGQKEPPTEETPETPETPEVAKKRKEEFDDLMAKIDKLYKDTEKEFIDIMNFNFELPWAKGVALGMLSADGAVKLRKIGDEVLESKNLSDEQKEKLQAKIQMTARDLAQFAAMQSYGPVLSSIFSAFSPSDAPAQGPDVDAEDSRPLGPFTGGQLVPVTQGQVAGFSPQASQGLLQIFGDPKNIFIGITAAAAAAKIYSTIATAAPGIVSGVSGAVLSMAPYAGDIVKLGTVFASSIGETARGLLLGLQDQLTSVDVQYISDTLEQVANNLQLGGAQRQQIELLEKLVSADSVDREEPPPKDEDDSLERVSKLESIAQYAEEPGVVPETNDSISSIEADDEVLEDISTTLTLLDNVLAASRRPIRDAADAARRESIRVDLRDRFSIFGSLRPRIPFLPIEVATNDRGQFPNSIVQMKPSEIKGISVDEKRQLFSEKWPVARAYNVGEKLTPDDPVVRTDLREEDTMSLNPVGGGDKYQLYKNATLVFPLVQFDFMGNLSAPQDQQELDEQQWREASDAQVPIEEKPKPINLGGFDPDLFPFFRP
jgi:hypothetical protein